MIEIPPPPPTADLRCVRGHSITFARHMHSCTPSGQQLQSAHNHTCLLALVPFNNCHLIPLHQISPAARASPLHTPLQRSVFASCECTLHLSTPFFVECQTCCKYAVDMRTSTNRSQTQTVRLTVQLRSLSCSSHASRCCIRLAAETSRSATHQASGGRTWSNTLSLGTSLQLT